MNPPTPAAVREALTDEITKLKDIDVLRDHIRAIAAGMRNLGDAMVVDRTADEVRQVLREYANRLEGREP